jgi:DNA-binding transcriptional LysR family regulator
MLAQSLILWKLSLLTPSIRKADMRELNLDQLRTLVAVADLGSFSAAARALHLAQPTVSLQVSELEARLGVPLLLRGPRRVAPTSAGAVLLERGRRLLRDADEAVDATRRHAAGGVGRVRLGTASNVLMNVLPQVLETLAQRHPGIDVEVSVLGSAESLARLSLGSLDIGLVALPQPARRELVLSPWRSDPMMAFVPARWDAPKRINPAWLAARPLVFNDASTHMYRLTMEWFAAAGLGPRARIELNATEAMKGLVAAGYGASVLPLELPGAQQALGGKLKILPLTPKLTRHTGIAHRPLQDGDAAIRTVLEVLAAFRQR